jgi:uncharacterized membrane protein YphA (DoxX/SURF4 family)
LRLVLAAAFFYAGSVKIWDFSGGQWATPQFFEDILNYHLLPWDAAAVLAVYLPWLEIAAALGLFSRRHRAGALLILGIMLVVFSGAMASAWWRGLDISCGCFGREVEKGDWGIPLGRDLVLLAAVLAVAWLERKTPPLSNS